MNKISTTLYSTGIIPVIKITNADDAIPLARALLNGGLPAAEITFRTAAAAESIYAISRAVPDVFVCAGTVINIEQAETAVNCGAKALISPGLNPRIVNKALELGTTIFPGIATPTELEAAIGLGLDTVKLFPAEVLGGISMLKALAGPYSHIKFMPTGGITLSSVKDYLKLSNVLACGGSWICPEELIESKNFEAIEKLAREAANIVNSIRNFH